MNSIRIYFLGITFSHMNLGRQEIAVINLFCVGNYDGNCRLPPLIPRAENASLPPTWSNIFNNIYLDPDVTFQIYFEFQNCSLLVVTKTKYVFFYYDERSLQVMVSSAHRAWSTKLFENQARKIIAWDMIDLRFGLLSNLRGK